MSIIYKGFEINPSSTQLADSEEWTVSVYIKKYHNDTISSLPFFAKNTYKTKEDADNHSIEFGKQIIDGNYPGLSVSDL